MVITKEVLTTGWISHAAYRCMIWMTLQRCKILEGLTSQTEEKYTDLQLSRDLVPTQIAKHGHPKACLTLTLYVCIGKIYWVTQETKRFEDLSMHAKRSWDLRLFQLWNLELMVPPLVNLGKIKAWNNLMHDRNALHLSRINRPMKFLIL